MTITISLIICLCKLYSFITRHACPLPEVSPEPIGGQESLQDGAPLAGPQRLLPGAPAGCLLHGGQLRGAGRRREDEEDKSQ